MRCMICDQTMSQSISWLFSCSHCGFSASTLTAGGGRGVEGLESLRRRNFGTLCNWLDRRYQLAGKSLLEVGCAEGWFLEEVRRHGVVPVGIEPTFAHAEMSREKGFDVINGFFRYLNTVTLKRFISRYSCLQHIATFSLDALAKDGLWDRVKTSHAGLTGRVIYACLRLFLPLFVLFPSDIVVGVFQKPLSE